MMVPSKSVLVLSMIAALTACGGGGGGGSSNGGTDSDPNASPNTGGQTAALLPCTNTATTQCSGGSIVRTENSVAMTEFGVQVYGASTSDTVPPANNPNTTAAWGLAPASGGVAEVRLQRNDSGTITRAGVLLKDVGISWDRQKDRPPVIEIFSPTQGRATLASDSSRSVLFGPLPPSSDLTHYDWALKGSAGTQANYANNVYFPREEPIRCPANDVQCPQDYSTVVPKLKFKAGPWRTDGQTVEAAADEMSVSRRHEDGDLRAGDDIPGPNGERRWISDSDGFGVSYPGFKGYRVLDNWSYGYANLANWLTQDTVEIVEWAGGANEHNKVRRGFVAFGDVTAESAIPTSGTATYQGAIYGFFAPNAVAQSAADEVRQFRGKATITVNFANRTAAVTFTDTNVFDETASPVPASFAVTAALGGANGAPLNYFSGSVSNALREGGLGARFFGPVSAGGPAELGGTMSFTYTPANAGPNGRQTVIAGFIARKQ